MAQSPANQSWSLPIIYAGRHAEALALLDSLRDVIEDMPEPDSDGINWAHAHILGHLNDELYQLLDCVKG